MKHVYLGPSQVTFSALAHAKFLKLFQLPSVTSEDEILAESNEQVLPLITKHAGLGVIAMETEAEGRIDQPINSFVQLLQGYKNEESCPFEVIAALRMSVSFALMARPEVPLDQIKTVIAHPKALGACKTRLSAYGMTNFVEADSNGKAADEVARNPAYAHAAALGPEIAAAKYGLKILENCCEDQPAFTTFFLLAPKVRKPLTEQKVLSEINRSLLIFRVNHRPRALVNVLEPFADAELNLRQVHSYYVGKGQYDFALEIDSTGIESQVHAQAINKAKKYMDRHILFGPFPVL